MSMSSLLKFFVADKNHNPRKGTETVCLPVFHRRAVQADKNHNPRKGTETTVIKSIIFINKCLIRTIIPARGRKLFMRASNGSVKIRDKNHNPRKGTETCSCAGANM